MLFCEWPIRRHHENHHINYTFNVLRLKQFFPSSIWNYCGKSVKCNFNSSLLHSFHQNEDSETYQNI